MSDTFEKTFHVSTPAHLDLGNIRGSVEIRPGEESAIHVTAVKTGLGDHERTQIEMTQDADGTVRVATRFPDIAWSWLFGSFPCSVDYVVTAPAKCSIKVNGFSNSVSAQGFSGEFSFNSVSGEIELRNLTGPVRVHSVSGKVTGEEISGSLDLDTVSGDVRLTASSFAKVKSNTVSAGVNLQTGLAAGPYFFNTVSGNVRLTLPAEARCTAEMHSVSGQISSVFPISGYSHSHGTHTAQVQGGGAHVDLHSVSADLVLESNGPVQPGPAAKAEPSVDERRESKN